MSKYNHREGDIRRAMAMQKENVPPPSGRRWAELEKERVTAMGKPHLAPHEPYAGGTLSESHEPLEDRERLKVQRAMRALFPPLKPRPQSREENEGCLHLIDEFLNLPAEDCSPDLVSSVFGPIETHFALDANATEEVLRAMGELSLALRSHSAQAKDCMFSLAPSSLPHIETLRDYLLRGLQVKSRTEAEATTLQVNSLIAQPRASCH